MKTLLSFAVLVTLVVATWLFFPLLQGRDADFETRLALLQGRGGDFVDTPSEATPTPPSQAPEAAPSRPLSGPADSVEAGGAMGKAAETSIGEESGDRSSTIENGQTREPGQQHFPLAPPVDPENDTAASAIDAVRTQQDASLAFMVRQRLRTLGLDPGQLTLDAELGPQARAAIKKYQREHSLPVDGQVSVALLDHLDRVLSGDGRTGEEDAETKVAEAPPAPPADQPGSADMDSARAERLQTAGTEPSEEALSQRGPLGDGRTGDEGAEAGSSSKPTARVGGYEHFQKGFAVAKDGRPDLAIDHYTRAIESGDLSQEHLAYIFSNRGVIYWAIGVFDQAIEDFDEAVRLKPDYAQAYHNRGIAYHDKGLDEQAIADLDNAIRLDPDYATAYFNRGLAYDKMGLYDRASDDYSKAIQLQPDLDAAYFNRGRMHEAKGRQPSAVQDFQRAYSLDPSDPNYVETAAAEDKNRETRAPLEAVPPPPALPPPAPKTPAKEAKTAPAYQVQLAAVRSLERAQGEWERLRRKNSDLLGNLTLSVAKADLGPKKGVFYRLRAGPVADEAASRALCAKLARHRMGCLVVRPGG